MKQKLTPEILQNSDEFELLAEVSHDRLKEFVVEQITKEKQIVRVYSVYQVVMMLVFAYFFTRAVVLAIKGFYEPFWGVAIALVFSFSALVVIHELLHALAYLVTGARKISFGWIPRKFIFYALADKEVIRSGAFGFVALAPFVVVKVAAIGGLLLFYSNATLVYFCIGVMCLHSLFCAGDMAMLAFYNLHRGEEILNFDDRSEGKTYFYRRKTDIETYNNF